MNFKHYFFSLIVAFHSCGKKVEEKKFEIKGVLSQDFDGYIHLKYGNTLDSVLVNENKFYFEGKVDNVEYGSLGLNRGEEEAILYIENCPINIKTKIDFRDSNDNVKIPYLSIDNIKGTKTEVIRKDYVNFYQQNQNKDNFSVLLYRKLDTLISENNSNPFCGGILAGNAIVSPKLSRAQFLKLYKKLDTTKQRTTDLRLLKNALARLEKFPRGRPFLSFTLPNKEGRMLQFDRHYDRITLIDFWASWCVPCRKINPEFVALKTRLSSEDFDILGISIDDNMDQWVKAIENDKLEWTNLWDQSKEVYSELDVVGVPYSYLVDKNGIILDINPTIQEIEKIVLEKASK